MAAAVNVAVPPLQTVCVAGLTVTTGMVSTVSVAAEVFVHHAVLDYAVRIVMTTRDPETGGLPQVAPHISLGASPRATLGMIAAGRALAVLRGRRFLTPQDIFDVAPEILRHRLILSYDALAEGITADNVIRQVLSTVSAPNVTPRQDDANPAQTPATGANWLEETA